MSNLPFLAHGFSINPVSPSIPDYVGVYALYCRAVDCIYFGSTVQGFRKRLSQHVLCLKRNEHHSFWLQRHVNEYGFDAFSFHVVNICEPDECFDREQQWLDWRGVGINNRSYNVCPTADISKGVAEVNSLEFVVTTPNGQELYIKNLAKFCRENSLANTHMFEVAQGVHDQHKGWRCRYAWESREEHEARLGLLKRNREYIVTAPDGTEVVIKNLKRFCEQYGLNNSAMTAIANGNRRIYKGWMCRLVNEPEDIKAKRLAMKGKNKRYIVTFPNGYECEIEGLPDFCEQYDLCPSSMTKVALGKTSQHKGFRVRYAE